MQRPDELDELRRRLLAQSWLYDDPQAYTSGVEAALRAVRRLPLKESSVPSDRSAS